MFREKRGKFIGLMSGRFCKVNGWRNWDFEEFCSFFPRRKKRSEASSLEMCNSFWLGSLLKKFCNAEKSHRHKGGDTWSGSACPAALKWGAKSYQAACVVVFRTAWPHEAAGRRSVLKNSIGRGFTPNRVCGIIQRILETRTQTATNSRRFRFSVQNCYL